MQRQRVEIGAILLCAMLAAGTARAANDRTAVGIFQGWGAFREGTAERPARCYAIAEPPKTSSAAGHGAFASVASWPARRVRAQLAIRLSHAVGGDGRAVLSVAGSSFALVARGTGAWARDRRQDAAIVAAMRSASSMSISAVGANGNPFADGYRLRGAASAIDAAMLACPMR